MKELLFLLFLKLFIDDIEYQGIIKNDFFILFKILEV